MFEKQTIRELKEKHGVYQKGLKNILGSYEAPEKHHDPREVHVVADATYFGERKENTSWCVVVFRDQKRKENLWWNFFNTETTSAYLEGREYLERLGYTILSVTGDGFGGLRQAFSDIPYQMCHVHMKRIVVSGTTQNPELEAGQALLALTKTLHYSEGETFKKYFKKYLEKYQTFINQKSVNPETGRMSLTHEPLYRAVMSLWRLLPFLFTFEKNKSIPKTTNTLEGHFTHIKDIVGIHRGLPRANMERVLHSILLASTIAPSKKKLKYII